MGWHTAMEFSPSLVGCVISSANHSYELISASKECVINVPTVDLADEVVASAIAPARKSTNSKSSSSPPLPPTKVKAPLIAECYAASMQTGRRPACATNIIFSSLK